MSTTIDVNGGSVEVSSLTLDATEEVVIEVESRDALAVLSVTPGEAVRISRALVAAAAEALRVEV